MTPTVRYFSTGQAMCLTANYFPTRRTGHSPYHLMPSPSVPTPHSHHSGLKMRRFSQSPDESYRHPTTIYMLPDGVLLEVFDFYQRHRFYRGSHKWQRLVRVCRRWRHIIFASPLRLDLTLLCTYGTPVRKNLGCWPPLPIFVNYVTWNGTGRAPNYEVDVTAALEHRDRIRSIKLALTGSVLEIVAPVMQETFLVLTELWLSSKDRNAPVLLDTFLGGSAPSLQFIYLWGISFPSLPTLLLSTSDLFYLRLEDIPQSGYISPEAMVRGLAALTRLESLWIWFKSSTPRFELLYFPFLTRSVLPSLISFNFREHLLARINTPRLHFLEISYFNQLDFWVPQLSQFIGRTESLELAQSRHAQVRFQLDTICVEFYCEEEGRRLCRLIIRISCKWLDWQVSCLAQILGQSPTMVSSVDYLLIDRANLHLEPDWQEDDEDMDDIDWLELLRPFTAVKTLHGSKQLAGHIALALDGVNGEIVTEELPVLDTLSLEDQSLRSVEQFITVRRLSGHPITFVDPAPLPATDVLVDGYVARTFTPGDATNYFMRLLKTPSSQSFLQYYGVVYRQDAWYITYNVDLQATSPGVLLQTSPVLDHSIRESYGTVVPQRRWIPADEVDVRRYVDFAELQLPIFFVNHNDSIGFRLPDILRGCDGDLHKANSSASLGGQPSTMIRINWPGYGHWKRQIAIRDETHARNPITMGRFMRHVGKSVEKFFRECKSNGCAATDPRWQIGMHGGITQEQVKIVGAINVTAGSWMPILQLTRYVI